MHIILKRFGWRFLSVYNYDHNLHGENSFFKLIPTSLKFKDNCYWAQSQRKILFNLKKSTFFVSKRKFLLNSKCQFLLNSKGNVICDEENLYLIQFYVALIQLVFSFGQNADT